MTHNWNRRQFIQVTGMAGLATTVWATGSIGHASLLTNEYSSQISASPRRSTVNAAVEHKVDHWEGTQIWSGSRGQSLHLHTHTGTVELHTSQTTLIGQVHELLAIESAIHMELRHAFPHDSQRILDRAQDIALALGRPELA